MLSATLVLALGSFAPVQAQHASAPETALTAWTGVADAWEERVMTGGVVGSSIAWLHGGELHDLRTHGLADVEASRPVTDRTIYHWASITKTMTAIGIMQLRDDGHIDLDDPIVDYVPELRGVHNPFGSMEEITIRHLLSHSAGFRGGTWPYAGGEAWHPHEPTEWSQLVSMVPYTEIHFEPGSRYAYSNPGIIFLGRVIEAVSGDVFEAYVDKNIFSPLGMRESYFDGTPRPLREHRSNHYSVVDGTPVAGGLDFNTGITVSNGGLNAPLTDMAKYFAFLSGHGDHAVHASVLDRASLEEMWEPVVPMGENPMGDAFMGLSFFLYDLDGHRVVGHTGTQRTFYSFFVMDRASGSVVFAAFNTGGSGGGMPDTNDIRVSVSEQVVRTLFPELRGG
ncbi:MAG: serine hydrolase domain-containing protein [Gemmatimonadota bacterium]